MKYSIGDWVYIVDYDKEFFNAHAIPRVGVITGISPKMRKTYELENNTGWIVFEEELRYATEIEKVLYED